MKTFIQLIFFLFALICTFIAVIFWFALISDSTPQGLFQIAPIDNYDEDELLFMFGGAFISSFLSIITYFMLWKTNFFTRLPTKEAPKKPETPEEDIEAKKLRFQKAQQENKKTAITFVIVSISLIALYLLFNL